MQKQTLYSLFKINQSLIMDNLEFGSTCCVILALPPTPLWPWKFLIPCTHLPILTVDLIFALQVVGCCWVGELKPSNNVNRNQEKTEEAALRMREFQSFPSPKTFILCLCVFHVLTSPGADSHWGISAGEVVPSFQGVIPGPDLPPKLHFPPVELSAPAPVLYWWHWDAPITPGAGNWGISIPSTAAGVWDELWVHGQQSQLSINEAEHLLLPLQALEGALKSTFCVCTALIWRLNFFGSSFFVVVVFVFCVYQERFVLFSDKPHFKKKDCLVGLCRK